MRISVLAKSLLFFAALTTTMSPVALAVPYASGISESGGTVTYVLNEDADAITVKRTGDTDLVLSGDDLLKGTHTFAKGGASAYQIEVSKSTASEWTQTNDISEETSQYFSPRGVVVNKNPSSPHFGNVYISEGLGGPTANRPNETLSGIYAISADGGDVFGLGDDGADGGLGISTFDGNSNSPYHLSIDADDNIYIAGFSDAASNVWRAPGDLSGTWPQLLANEVGAAPNDGTGGNFINHGSIPSTWVEGTGANTVLYTIDEDWPTPDGIFGDGRGDILQYNIGTATEFTGLPTLRVEDAPAPSGLILNFNMDFVRDEDGTWWISQLRFDDTEGVPSLSHWADDPNGGEALWTSGRPSEKLDADFDRDQDIDGADFLTWQRNLGEAGSNPAGDANFDGNITEEDLPIWEDQYGTTTDFIAIDRAGRSLDIDNERDLIIMSGNGGEGVRIIDISDPNDPSIVANLPQAGTTNDVAFDIAGNAYVVSRTSETLVVWSPGGDTVAVTGSDGSFAVNPPSSIAAVPEPQAVALFVVGLACLFCCRVSLSRQRPCYAASASNRPAR